MIKILCLTSQLGLEDQLYINIRIKGKVFRWQLEDLIIYLSMYHFFAINFTCVGESQLVSRCCIQYSMELTIQDATNFQRGVSDVEVDGSHWGSCKLDYRNVHAFQAIHH